MRSVDHTKHQHYDAVSCLFSIPQKLSKSTLSLPCNHRTTTSTPPSSPFLSRTLKPNAGAPSPSPSFIAWSLSVEWEGLCCCCFRLAARDQTFSLAKPTPVAMIGRYCHRRSRAWSVSFRRREQFSSEVSTVKEDSDGKGSRCLGSVEVPLATSFVVSVSLRTKTMRRKMLHERYSAA